ncbi:unnamed protein product [Cylicocyclus nassatus]|uniref:Uncharacterized protein n=1 Tax=Cylicocyclus nassatus TaxID=53992 RepID=A0AA36GRI6_CYLNA|nr:unnamed protein product [Cylicocyclus nassatus]
MSHSDPESYEPRNYQKHCVRNRKHGKRTLVEGTFITKTFYDPSNSLSKSSRRRMLHDQLDDLCPDVPYSLNKRERWKLSIRSFLGNRQPNSSQTLETLLVSRSDVPSDESEGNEKICKIELLQNDDVAVLSSGGKTMPMRYYSNQIRTLRRMDKKEVEPSRVLYNITIPSSSKTKSKKVFRKSHRRHVAAAEFDCFDESEDYSDDSPEISDCELYKPLREITLADYLSPKEHQQNRDLHDKSQIKSASNCRGDGIGKQLTNPPSSPDKSVDASLLEVAGTPHIFDVLEIFTEQQIDLREVLNSIPQWLIVKSFGPQHLFVSSPAVSKPVFVLFFEVEEERKIFRIRISTDSSYSHAASRNRLLNTIFKRKINIPLLFSNIHVFILQTEVAKPVEPRFGSRFNLYPENFESEVNSGMISPKKSFTSANPRLKIEKCPHCSVTLTIPPVCEYNSCSCSNCGCVFCYLCKWEPHWPMDCEQFKQWSAKWDTHYLFESNNVFEGKQVRICCECGRAFHVDKNFSGPIRCPAPDCWWSYDENGVHHHYHKYVPASTPKVVAHLAALGEVIKPCPECGRRLEPSTVKARSIIDKNFSSLCSKARKQRFITHKRGDFEKFISEILPTKKEQLAAIDLRKTALFLVGNCTALLYITKPDNCYALRKEVANLLRKLLLIQSRTSAITKGEFITEMNKLRESTGSLIELFRKYIKVE